MDSHGDTLEAYRQRMQPQPPSRREMARQLGISWNSYLKYANTPAPRTYALAAWTVVHWNNIKANQHAHQ